MPLAKITLSAGAFVASAELDDHPTSRDFLKTLPLTLRMTRYDDREYYGVLGGPLAAGGPVQAGYTDGDLTFWTPGGSLAVFFAKGATETVGNLVVLGRITSNLEGFVRQAPSISLKITLA